jgi:hypothetical protein
MKEYKHICRILVGKKLKVGSNSEGVHVDMRIILKWILKINTV